MSRRPESSLAWLYSQCWVFAESSSFANRSSAMAHQLSRLSRRSSIYPPSLAAGRLHETAPTIAAPAVRAESIRSPTALPLSSGCPTRSITTLQIKSIKASQVEETLSSAFPHRSSHTATMSTMPASHGHNEACCNIPPTVAEGYVAKGSYTEVGGFKSCKDVPSHTLPLASKEYSLVSQPAVTNEVDITGPASATKGIIIIYDIFGYFDQTLQGADILATSDKQQQYKVFIPDWFKGKPCPIEWCGHQMPRNG